MPYAIRDSAGKIIALYDTETAIDAQWLTDDEPEVLEYRHSQSLSNKVLQELEESDLELIRVLEDVVDLLIKKQVFAITELPPFAQEKLSKRQRLRSDMISLSPLIDTDEGIF
ncbi:MULTISPECIES: hypothetical protein [Methylotuvimicrobium]|uniref:Tryptophan synthase subunit beta like protein n=2 Tax=Methylotuvimicrobium TaxID=2822410 RepID=G4SXI4_META2|nr:MULTISPECIES: hypothetical protein [Methylotuvimicrobium]QCW84282.1 hypothetical protein EQU24_20140 [Methylotuvimicrobium buryatense]CCE25348.1 conserved protein of unknown function [Methylotuvimicrobium alcaliphilum 20Z]